MLSALAAGLTLSSDTMVVDVAVHPLVVEVTVTVYVPATVTNFDMLFPPPLHA